MIEATGILSRPLNALRQMVANSTAFQQWVGVESAAAAFPACICSRLRKARSYPSH